MIFLKTYVNFFNLALRDEYRLMRQYAFDRIMPGTIVIHVRELLVHAPCL